MPPRRVKCYSYIRFSTPEQLKGHSLKRQLQRSEEYAKKHGLVIDKSLEADKGLSAFHGKHKSKGHLGRFLKHVESGQIEKGSVLLVESLDRLSREQVIDAFDQFRAIIKQGIKIVTLIDEQEYTEESLNTNFGQLLISLTIMSRAHEESLTKSNRLLAAWKAKRDGLNERKLTAKCPAWVILNKKEQKFIEIPERIKLVRRIFNMSLNGYGANVICKRINADGTKPWGKPRQKNKQNHLWHTSYIKKILKNKAVLGEFQPHKIVKGKRVPEGDPISDYYPRLIEDNIFYQVQDRLRRNTKFPGKTGNITNLFGGLAKCGNCGASMAFVNKGKTPKGGQYLVCDRSRRGGGCTYRSVRYDEFEESIIKYCIGLNVEELMNQNDEQKTRVEILRSELTGIKGQISNAETRIQNLTDAIATTSDDRVRKQLDTKLSDNFDEMERLEKKAKSVAAELNRLTQSREVVQASFDDLKDLFSRLKETDDDERISLRLRVRNKLRDLIERITVFPVGYTDEFSERFMGKVLSIFPEFKEDPDSLERLRDHFYSRTNNRKYRKFIIQFSTGTIRSIEPETEKRRTYEGDIITQVSHELILNPIL